MIELSTRYISVIAIDLYFGEEVMEEVNLEKYSSFLSQTPWIKKLVFYKTVRKITIGYLEPVHFLRVKDLNHLINVDSKNLCQLLQIPVSDIKNVGVITKH